VEVDSERLKGQEDLSLQIIAAYVRHALLDRLYQPSSTGTMLS
jgi:hypothetical protein